MDKGRLISVGRTAEVYAWGSDRVLKLYRPDMPRELVYEEAEIGRIVSDARLHAPAIGETEVDGRLGILYERIAGPSMLDVLARRPWRWRGLARRFAEVHAAMHQTARPELPSQRQGFAWAIAHAPRLDEAVRQRALEALERMPGGDSVCHGDYHPANLRSDVAPPQTLFKLVIAPWTPAGKGATRQHGMILQQPFVGVK